MRYKFQFFLVVVLKIVSSLADNNCEDYALLVQRRMQNDIKIAEIQVDFLNDRYNDMMAIILDRQERIQQEIYQTDERLTFMQAVNSSYRTCIQKYKPAMYTQQQAQAKFNACLNATKAKSQKLMLDVETPLNFAKNTANVQLPIAVSTCRAFSNNNTQESECVVEKVVTHSETFDDDLNDAQDKLEVNVGLSSLVIRNSMECSFEAEREILVKLGGSLQSIDICLENVKVAGISEIVLI